MKKTILFFSFIGCCFVALSQATTYCVDVNFSGSVSGTLGMPTNPYRTIQAAIVDAKNGDIIKVAKGTYSEAVTISEKKLQLLGGFAGNGNFTTVDTVANKTIIKGTKTKPCILVQFFNNAITGTLIISGFTIREGQRGIELYDANAKDVVTNITIENNIIEANGDSLLRTGGIGLAGKDVIIQKNIIRNNIAERGAAIGVMGKSTNYLIADNLIEKNLAYGDHAGGVSINGKGTVTRNVFDGNNVGASADINYGWGWGGGILIFDDPHPSNHRDTEVTLSHNVYRNNSAPSSGGAVFVDDGAKVWMKNELLYNNKTGKEGSAIFVDPDQEYNRSFLYIDNCTVAGNSSDDPDGAALFVSGCHAEVQNCIFWNNGSDILAEDAVEDIYDDDWNWLGTELLSAAILKVNYTLTQHNIKGATAAGTGNIISDPLFADAANSNVAKRDFHLKSKYGRYTATGFVNDAMHSPAIDAGNPASPYTNEPSPNGGRVNMGCYGNTAEASKSAGTGVEEITQILWTMFPNPAKESITISHLPSGSTISITDITGKKVYSSTVKNEQTTISTANFENGVYIIQVADNGDVAYRKFVVRK